jgi:hypothetical protein
LPQYDALGCYLTEGSFHNGAVRQLAPQVAPDVLAELPRKAQWTVNPRRGDFQELEFLPERVPDKLRQDSIGDCRALPMGNSLFVVDVEHQTLPPREPNQACLQKVTPMSLANAPELLHDGFWNRWLHEKRNGITSRVSRKTVR